MALRIYNSLTKTKEVFTPINPGKVNIYVCGITAYDRCHMGHARSVVFFDVVVRYLEHRGYDVTYVRNFTDIDDKIIKRANEEGKNWDSIAKRYIGEFYRDTDKLGVKRPTAEPKATDHIQDMIDTIRELIDRGHAYQADGDVFFAVDTFPDYGKLSRRKLEDLEAGSRVKIDPRKRNPFDFALWKESKPGEPMWESPWGKGRPGWHIECSVMANKYLSSAIDIHGGGQDLVFPHHENEIAQSEAVTGRPFARYWMHNGFVYIDKQKMSKSLGNIFGIEEALNVYHPEVIRLFLISRHYRGPLDFSEEAISEAEAGLERLYNTLKSLEDNLAGFKEETPPGKADLDEEEIEIRRRIGDLANRFHEAMDDDFNTVMAMGHVFDAARALNRFMDISSRKDAPIFPAILHQGKERFREIGEVLGIMVSDPAQYLEDQKRRKLSLLNVNLSELEAKIEERNRARREKEWTRADEIRAELAERGISLEDGPDGTTWRIA